MVAVMHRILLAVVLPSVFLAGCAERGEDTAVASAVSSAVVPDHIFHGGRVYTANASQDFASAFAVVGDRLLAVGVDEAVLALAGPATLRTDLQGALVLPGLHDAHIHPGGVVKYESCNLESRSLNLLQLSHFVAECLAARELPAGEWLTVRQWSFGGDNLPAGGFGTLRAALDAAAPNTPVILLGNDGHHHATNSAGLALATNAAGEQVGLSAATLTTDFPQLEPFVGLDAAGEPNGAINEGVYRVLGAPGLIEADADLIAASARQLPELLNSQGITSIQDAAAMHTLLPFYDNLLATGPVPLRIRLAQYLLPEDYRRDDGGVDLDSMLADASAVRDRYAGSVTINANALKWFVDGVLEGNPLATPPTLPNAAVLRELHQPHFRLDQEQQALELLGYVDPEGAPCMAWQAAADTGADARRLFEAEHGFHPGQCQRSSGVMFEAAEVTRDFTAAADAAGFAVHFHAIGDRSVQAAVDAIAAVTAADVDVNRHSIAHLQLVSDADIQRLADLRVPLAFTYAWAHREYLYDLTVIPFIERLQSLDAMYDPDAYYTNHFYPAESVRKAGGILAAGSDAPVETDDPRPFFNIQIAVTRDEGQGSINPAQRLRVLDAIDAYTINGAKLMGQADLTGSLEAGKKADFVILDTDIVMLAESGRADAISDTRVRQTWFDGRLVYQDPAEQPVTLANFMQPPFSSWAFHHMRELVPTAEVYAGSGEPVPLAERPVDLDGLTFELVGGGSTDLANWLEASATDSFLVLHEGDIVYETYRNGMQPHSQHQMFSVTKSFVGTLVLMLIEEGRIDADKPVAGYLPELAASAFGDATVQQVLDMSTSIHFREEYTDPEAEIWQYGQLFRIGGDPPGGYRGLESIHDYLPTLRRREGAAHGEAFHYVTPNTDVLAWLLLRVSGQSLQTMLSERIWQPLGVERDGYFWLDRAGNAMAGGGLNVSARDAARFGQMLLQGGRYNGRQIVPETVAQRILRPRNRETFNVLYQDPWFEHVAWGYHDQWWSFNNDHRAVSAIGVHGQFIYIDKVAGMIIVKQSSHAEAEGEANEVHGPQIWHQIARYLLSRG